MLSEGPAGWDGTARARSLLAEELQETIVLQRASREAGLGFVGYAPSITSKGARV